MDWWGQSSHDLIVSTKPQMRLWWTFYMQTIATACQSTAGWPCKWIFHSSGRWECKIKGSALVSGDGRPLFLLQMSAFQLCPRMGSPLCPCTTSVSSYKNISLWDQDSTLTVSFYYNHVLNDSMYKTVMPGLRELTQEFGARQHNSVHWKALNFTLIAPESPTPEAGERCDMEGAHPFSLLPPNPFLFPLFKAY